VNALLLRGREWLRRYLPAEIAGVLAALGGALAAHRVSDSPVAAAVAGSACETVGYYATIGWRDFNWQYRALDGVAPTRRAWLTAGRTARDLAVEFGPAEVIDSAFVRPTLMYAGPLLTGQFLAGTLLGKLAADVVFYTFAITGYEVRKRLFSRPPVERAPDHVA
jgi:hypothetical protein